MVSTRTNHLKKKHLFSIFLVRLSIFSQVYLIVLIPIHNYAILIYFLAKLLKTYLLVRLLFLVKFFDIIHKIWCNSYLSVSYFYSMYCCNAQLIISSWKLRKINSSLLLLLIITPANTYPRKSRLFCVTRGSDIYRPVTNINNNNKT